MADKTSLIDRLKVLGIKPASSLDLTKPKEEARKSIEKVVQGRYLQSRFGETFVSEQVYAQNYLHGIASIKIKTPIPIIGNWAREPSFQSIQMDEYAFFDTETSGLAGGTGTYAFLVGIGRFVDGDFHLAQFFMRDPSEEPVLLEAVADFLAPCKALVSFNGKAFDAPLLSTRYTLHQIPVPFKAYAHLDLLPLARRLWRDRLPSRALKYLEENILLAPRTTDEVPGYEIPYIYFDYLRSGNASELAGVFYHNAMDVVALAALMSHITSILEDPLSPLVEHGLDTIALAKFFEDIGEWDTAARLFEHGLEMKLPEEDFWQAVKRLAQLQKRRGNMELAINLWDRAAKEGHIYAHIELAKFHEHVRKDYLTARGWTESAMQLVNEQDIPRYVYSHWMDELTHRMKRLEEKFGDGN
jgi:uncharacterized protein YprB with RNaseH-like and TPR domain